MSRYYLITIFTWLCLAAASEVHAAEWRECEHAKLRQLDLEQTRRQASPSTKSHQRKKTSQRSTSRVSAEQLDDWLWKNCREYSYELRTLEQQRM